MKHGVGMGTLPVSRPYTVYRSRRPPRAFAAGLLSALVPGVGQVYAGEHRRGLGMLGIAAALVVAALVVAFRGSVPLLQLLVRPDVLIALLVVDCLVFVFRAHCTVDAYRAARRARAIDGRPSGPAGGRAIVVLGLLAFVATPHAVLGWYDMRSYDVLTSVFAAQEPVSLLPTGPGGPTAGPTAGGVVTVGENREETPKALDRPEDRPSYWKKRGRVTFLLVGGDAGPYRYGLRTDTMIVLTIATESGRAALFGIPRNLIEVPFPPGARTELETFPDLLNALWGYAEAHPEVFPGSRTPGPTALKRTIGALLGLRIDYFAAVDLRGFVEVVDALGGVEVEVQRHVWDAGVSPPVEGEPLIAIDLEPGRHHLDGRQALAYVRTRWASSDYERMHRQRCLLGALAAQASVGKVIKAFPRLASTVKKFVLTDIPVKTLPDLLELLTELGEKQLIGVSFAPPVYDAGWERGDPIPDVELIRQTVRRAIAGTPRLDQSVGLEAIRTDCAA